jgi:archaemetzincin
VHEMGHCFGIDHCTYFHCFMQGSASLIEARSQPPYACPLEMVKLCAACRWDVAAMAQRDAALCCVLSSDAFAAAPMAREFAAWIQLRRAECAGTTQ